MPISHTIGALRYAFWSVLENTCGSGSNLVRTLLWNTWLTREIFIKNLPSNSLWVGHGTSLSPNPRSDRYILMWIINARALRYVWTDLCTNISRYKTECNGEIVRSVGNKRYSFFSQTHSFVLVLQPDSLGLDLTKILINRDHSDSRIDPSLSEFTHEWVCWSMFTLVNHSIANRCRSRHVVFFKI